MLCSVPSIAIAVTKARFAFSSLPLTAVAWQLLPKSRFGQLAQKQPVSCLRRAMGSRYHSNCAPLHTTLRTLSCPMPLRSILGRRLLGDFLSDLRLGSDGMKLQPAGSHHSRLSAGPPAVPSSSQPSYEIARIVARIENAVKLFISTYSVFICQNCPPEDKKWTLITPEFCVRIKRMEG